MHTSLKKIAVLILITFMFPVFFAYGENDLTPRFTDVPEGNWADELVHQARKLNITEGTGNNIFGYGQPVKRNEFVKFIISLMDWNLIHSEAGSFADNRDVHKWYYDYIETALERGIVTKESDYFRPEDYITREEMAIMIVRSLGYDGLARQLSFLGNPFDDIKQNEGYINIVKDLGIVTGKGDGIFDPYGTAKREEAIVMLMRMYNKLRNPLSELHGFYAINSSPQKDFIDELTSVSFGWSRLQYDSDLKKVVLSTGTSNGNEYYIPDGFSQRIEHAKSKGISTQLMVFASQDNIVITEDNAKGMGLVEYILSDAERRNAVANDILKIVDSIEKGTERASFDGVVIDFELLRGEELAKLFNEFLKELKDMLKDKKLYVAVHPRMKPGFACFDGYDYTTIGTVADKVILMAHDYGANSLTRDEMEAGYNDTPLAPIDEIYYALREITDSSKGIVDTDKIWLQISFDSIQWQKKDGRIINQNAKRPYYESIYNRLLQDVEINYSDTYKYPWATFNNKEDDIENIIWYEDSRSVSEKIKLAKMFGINGISLWRLGNIPSYENPHDKEIYLNVWQYIAGELYPDTAQK